MNLAPPLRGKRIFRSSGPSASTSKDVNLELASAAATRVKQVKHQIEILSSISLLLCRFGYGNGALGWVTAYGFGENDGLC
jgi:hypothetical protein